MTILFDICDAASVRHRAVTQEFAKALFTSGKYTSSLVVTDENREQIIYDGWIKFANLPPEAFEIVPPHGSDVRRMVHELEEKQ
jgi:hypothetical protein